MTNNPITNIPDPIKTTIRDALTEIFEMESDSIDDPETLDRCIDLIRALNAIGSHIDALEYSIAIIRELASKGGAE